MLRPRTWASEGGQGDLGHPWILKILSKKIVFLVSSGKKTNFTTFGLPRKILEKSPSAPPEKSFRWPCPRRSPWSIYFRHL